MSLPPITSVVRWRRSRYQVVGHGCATGMMHCRNGENAITVIRLPGPEYAQTECLNALECQIDEGR